MPANCGNFLPVAKGRNQIDTSNKYYKTTKPIVVEINRQNQVCLYTPTKSMFIF